MIQPKQKNLIVIIHKQQTKQNMTKYSLKCAFNTTINTFVTRQREGHLDSWQRINNLNIPKLLTTLEVSAKGYMIQEQQNLQSTKTKSFTEGMQMTDSNNNKR